MARRLLALSAGLLLALGIATGFAPSAFASCMDVPLFKQGDPQWATLHLGGSGYTMHSSGCAVTSCAMVAVYFGSSKDPGALCEALDADGGLTSGGNLSWQMVPATAEGTMSFVSRYYYCSLPLINQELDSGYPVIAEVHLDGDTHFVVLTGHSGSLYYINDPAYGDRTTLNSRYGDPNKAICGFCVYHGTSTVPAPSAYTRYEETDPLLTYAGTWGVCASGVASGGSFLYASNAGTSVTATFTGTYLAWIAKKSPVYGTASVSLDGGAPVTVDLYDAVTLWQQPVWETGVLSPGTHTVRIEWTGAKNPAATGTSIGVDALDIVGSLVGPGAASPATPANGATVAQAFSAPGSVEVSSPGGSAMGSSGGLAFPAAPPWEEGWWLSPSGWVPVG